MDQRAILLAKAAAVLQNLRGVSWGVAGRTDARVVNHELVLFDSVRKALQEQLPDLYSDLPMVDLPKPIGRNDKGFDLYSKNSFEPIVKNLEYILEVHSSSRIGEKQEELERPRRVFISHGRSDAWFRVQTFIEKDIGLESLELAQQPNKGRTILQKLNEEASRCGFAVIVMTGDDVAGDEIRARENVMHEIGFFQGKYGLHNIALLHEAGVNIPTNIDGLAYIPFAKGSIESALPGLLRELKVFMGA
jgi:hypothetical protein